MSYILLAILVSGIATYLSRSLAYFFFSKRQAFSFLFYLQRFMPLMIMVILVCFIFKGVDFSKYYGLPELFSIALTIIVEALFKRGFLSIVCGTACYVLIIELLLT